jgi:hypothetical protein
MYSVRDICLTSTTTGMFRSQNSSPSTCQQTEQNFVAVTVHTCTQEDGVLLASNFGQNNGYCDWGVLWFSSNIRVHSNSGTIAPQPHPPFLYTSLTFLYYSTLHSLDMDWVVQDPRKRRNCCPVYITRHEDMCDHGPQSLQSRYWISQCLSRYSDRLRASRPEFDYRQGKEILPFSTSFRRTGIAQSV